MPSLNTGMALLMATLGAVVGRIIIAIVLAIVSAEVIFDDAEAIIEDVHSLSEPCQLSGNLPHHRLYPSLVAEEQGRKAKARVSDQQCACKKDDGTAIGVIKYSQGSRFAASPRVKHGWVIICDVDIWCPSVHQAVVWLRLGTRRVHR